MKNFGFIKVSAAVPPLKIADTDFNVKKILEFAKKSEKQGSTLTVFPELSLAGYTAGDLFHQKILLEKTLASIYRLKTASKKLKSVLIIGAPLEHEGKIFNTAVVIFGGKILGIVPKTYLPNYKEFYEKRWFASAKNLNSKTIRLFGNETPIGTDILFRLKNFPEAVIGIEICEDLWVPIPPSSHLALNGATIIANLSGSNELIGKADYRRQLIAQQSARLFAGYIYAGSGVHESTTDLVFSGHSIIAENGSILSEAKRFARDGEIISSELDLEHIWSDRNLTTSFGENANETVKKEFRIIDIPAHLAVKPPSGLARHIDPHPFVPQNPLELDKRSEEIFAIQTAGLAKRLEYASTKKVVLGLSGGLDSTLAILVAVKTFQLIKLPIKNILCFTLPGFATTKRTKSNAVLLAEALGATLETIDITNGVSLQLKELRHERKEDVTYQNAQARYRTMILMNKSNQLGALMMGTGDLSEIALGWNTFSGDHISHYNVNASVPKTLVKYLVDWAARQKEFEPAQKILKDILSTPISPELAGGGKNIISQRTEDLIGPYALHDFFLYHFVRWGSSPAKILFLAKLAFLETRFPSGHIEKWLRVFLERFFKNQWKRSVMPDGPKVGSVSLSPRGDWRMPSDAEVKTWLKDLK